MITKCQKLSTTPSRNNYVLSLDSQFFLFLMENPEPVYSNHNEENRIEREEKESTRA